VYLENGCLYTELTFDSNCHLDLEIWGHQNAKVRKFTCWQVLKLYGSITFTFEVSCDKENVRAIAITTRANLYSRLKLWGHKMLNVPRFIYERTNERNVYFDLSITSLSSLYKVYCIAIVVYLVKYWANIQIVRKYLTYFTCKAS